MHPDLPPHLHIDDDPDTGSLAIIHHPPEPDLDAAAKEIPIKESPFLLGDWLESIFHEQFVQSFA
jgi:hypothetical protein